MLAPVDRQISIGIRPIDSTLHSSAVTLFIAGGTYYPHLASHPKPVVVKVRYEPAEVLHAVLVGWVVRALRVRCVRPLLSNGFLPAHSALLANRYWACARANSWTHMCRMKALQMRAEERVNTGV